LARSMIALWLFLALTLRLTLAMLSPHAGGTGVVS